MQPPFFLGLRSETGEREPEELDAKTLSSLSYYSYLRERRDLLLFFLSFRPREPDRERERLAEIL